MRIIKIIVILSLLLSFGCKTKKVIKNQSKEVDITEYTDKEHNEIKEVKIESNTKDILQVQKEDHKQQKTDIEIKGKVDKENPLTLYDIVKGDTMSSFKVIGNADIIFKTYRSDSSLTKNNSESVNIKESKQSTSIVSNAVESAVKKVKEAQSKTVEVVKKDFTIGSYIVFLIWGIVIIAILIFIMWLRKSTWWTNIINKFKNNGL